MGFKSWVLSLNRRHPFAWINGNFGPMWKRTIWCLLKSYLTTEGRYYCSCPKHIETDSISTGNSLSQSWAILLVLSINILIKIKIMLTIFFYFQIHKVLNMSSLPPPRHGKIPHNNLPGPSSNAGAGSNKPSRKRQHATSEASSSNIHASEGDLDKKGKFS